MTINYRHSPGAQPSQTAARSTSTLQERLAPRLDDLPPKVPYSANVSRDDTERRWRILKNHLEWMEVLADWHTLDKAEAFQGNIENFIGTLKMPVGLAGPLRVNGLFAHGDYYVPLATTEAALVASYSRGAQVISEAGGCSALLLEEGVSRAPAFAFQTL
ncbi:MAG TPA: hypothetical protein VE258_12170, partial [Ktedonobacterales bacterium]|nr:hypothetical protein [Ktedonobacterales bacterium]